MAGCFLAPAAGIGVGGEGFGVSPLQLQDGQEAGFGAEVRAVLADVSVNARALGGGAQAVPAGQPGFDERSVAPVPAGDVREGQLGAVGRQDGAELGFGLGQCPLVLVADGRVEQPLWRSQISELPEYPCPGRVIGMTGACYRPLPASSNRGIVRVVPSCA